MVLPPPQTRTFCQLHPIDHTAFLNDLKQTSLVTSPPESLSHIVDLYDNDSTLSNLLDKHAPIVAKRSACVTPSQPWFSFNHQFSQISRSRNAYSGMQLLTCEISFRHPFVFYLQVLSHPSLIHIMDQSVTCLMVHFILVLKLIFS